MTANGSTANIVIPSVFILYQDFYNLHNLLSNRNNGDVVYAMIDDGGGQPSPSFIQNLIIFAYLLLVILLVWCVIVCALTGCRVFHRARRTQQLLRIPVVVYKGALNGDNTDNNYQSNDGLNEPLNPPKSMEKCKIQTKYSESDNDEMELNRQQENRRDDHEMDIAVIDKESNIAEMHTLSRKEKSNQRKRLKTNIRNFFLRNKVTLQPRNTTCPICLDDFEDGQLVKVLLCLHGFHVQCIDPWLVVSNELCPVCKKNIFEKR